MATRSGPSGAAPAPQTMKLHRPGTSRRVVTSTVVLLAGVWLLFRVNDSKAIHWHVVGHYFASHAILIGLRLTLLLTVGSMAAGIVLGTILSLMRMSNTAVVTGAAQLYIWFFRGTPLLVQLIAWFNIALVFPHIALAGHTWNTNNVVSPTAAALLALGLNEGAYMSEIIRAGLQSVDVGQREAAQTVGLRPRHILFRIVIPQALPVIVPPTANQTIGMLKTTSLVSVIAAEDLLTQAEHIYAQNFDTIDLLIVASIWYLIMTTVATAGQMWLERRLSRGGRIPKIEAPA